MLKKLHDEPWCYESCTTCYTHPSFLILTFHLSLFSLFVSLFPLLLSRGLPYHIRFLSLFLFSLCFCLVGCPIKSDSCQSIYVYNNFHCVNKISIYLIIFLNWKGLTFQLNILNFTCVVVCDSYLSEKTWRKNGKMSERSRVERERSDDICHSNFYFFLLWWWTIGWGCGGQRFPCYSSWVFLKFHF